MEKTRNTAFDVVLLDLKDSYFSECMFHIKKEEKKKKPNLCMAQIIVTTLTTESFLLT